MAVHQKAAVSGPAQFQHTSLPKSKRPARLAAMLSIMATDVLIVIGSFVAGNVVRFGTPFHQGYADQAFNMLMVVLPVFLATALNARAYTLEALMFGRVGAYRAESSLLLALAAVALIVFFLKVSTDFSRLVFGIGSISSLLILPLFRTFSASIMSRFIHESPLTDVVIYDGVEMAVPRHFYSFDAERDAIAPTINDPVMMDRLGRLLKNADRVFVVCRPEGRARWALALKGCGVYAHLMMPELDDLGPLGLGRAAEHVTLQVATGPLRLTDRTLKRTLDLSVFLLTLPLSVPLMLVVALAIKLDSPGPIFFVQKRIGQGNRLFRMYKFRSMRTDKLDGEGLRSTGRGDDRVTRVGKIIRRTSIDELPQLLNVLGGSMSVVGPRPHAVASTAEDLLFWDIDARYWDRHAMKPGLTGLAQIRGFRGATARQSDLVDRLQADLEYLSGWSVWRDVAIILSTFRVLIHRNAF